MKSDEILQYTVEANVKFGNELKRRLRKLKMNTLSKQISKLDYQVALRQVREEINSIIEFVEDTYKSDEVKNDKEIKLWK